MEDKSYYTVETEGDLYCEKCDVLLEKGKAQFSYLGHGFPVELPICPKCGFAYVPEDLALGRILNVEKSLEDK